MTTLSMNAGQARSYLIQPNRPAARRTRQSERDTASDLAPRHDVAQALAVAGRLALALVPFSTLAWIFIAR